MSLISNDYFTLVFSRHSGSLVPSLLGHTEESDREREETLEPPEYKVYRIDVLPLSGDSA